MKEVLEQATGKVHRLYSYKRKPCRRVILDSRLAEQLSGYALIEKDLRSAKIWIEEINCIHTAGPTKDGDNFYRSTDRKKYNLIKGLFVAALTFYGKSFSKCEGRPVKLERVQLDEPYRELHETCMKYRHNFAAHSGAERLESVEIALVFPLKSSTPVLPKLYRELRQPDLFSPPTGEIKIEDLFEHARAVAVNKMELLSKKILTEEVLPKGQAFWLRK